MSDYRICTRCVMDTSAPDISFDEQGMCNYCSEFLEKHSHVLFKNEFQRTEERNGLVAKIKKAGRGKRYDCVIGVSGGVDSAWTLYQAVKSGLRPLAVHMDNGWNSELAQSNIENLVRKLGIDLYTHVIDWDEYRRLMQAFFDADVIDIELLYDNAMQAVNYRQAKQHGVKWILAGTNQATEGMRIPSTWNWFKYDKKNIKSLARKFGHGMRLKTFPAISISNLIYFRFIRRIKWVSFLDYFDYQKSDASIILGKSLGYKPYPYKHYESIFTRFYQGHLLPEKFGVDKRRLHLSTLVISKQMNRAEALSLMDQSPYPSQQDLESDIQYFLKKMHWSNDQFREYLLRKERLHAEYGSEKPFWDFLSKVQLSAGKLLGKK